MTEWKPKTWIAILLGVLIQPFAFLYLNKPKLFWTYFLLTFAAAAADWYFQIMLSPAFLVICPIHAYFLAKNYHSATNSHSVTNDRQWYSRWWGISGIYASVFVPIFIIRLFFYEPFLISNSSMIPTLNLGDQIIMKKFGYGGYGTYGAQLVDTGLSDSIELQRGNVYVLFPPDKEVAFVKRLIGKPGDKIEIRGYNVSVNGSPLKTVALVEDGEFALYEETLDGTTYQVKRTLAHPFIMDINLTVPADHYFFLGDNRDNSVDSRIWGTVAKDSFVGEVIYVFGH